MKLKAQAISGIRWTALENAISLLVSLASISILTRFLVPEDFGLMAIAMVVIGFSQAFVDMGFSNAILYRQDLTSRQLSTLYWLNLCAGLIVFAILLIGAQLVAGFYAEPSLQAVVMLASINFLILPLGQQFAVLMRKEFKFHLLSKIGIFGRLLTLLVAVLLAYYGFGVYALVISNLVGAAVTTILMIYFGLTYHRPALQMHVSEVKDFFSFGAYQMMEKMANYFNSNIDTIIIGRALGVGDLGIYNIAKQLTMRPAQMINPIVTRVALPLMAKMQNDIPQLKNIYLTSINYLCSVNFPIYFMIYFFANDITLLMLGEKWLHAVPTIQLLAIYCALRSIGNPVGSLLLARGRAKLAFLWNLALLAILPVSMFIGSFWGLHGIAMSLVIMSLALMLPNWLVLVQPLCGAAFVEYHRQIIKPAVIAWGGAVAAFHLVQAIDFAWGRLLLGAWLCLAFLLVLNFCFNRQFVSALQQFASERKSNQPEAAD